MIMQLKSKMASLSAEEPKGVMSANAVANFKTVTSANIDNRKGSLKFSGTEGLTADMIQKFISAIVNCEVTIDEEQLIATFPSKMYAEVVYKSRNNTPYTIEWVAEPVKNTVGSSQSPAQEDSEMAKDTKDSKDSKDSEEPQKEEAKEEPKTEPKETSQPKEAKPPEQAESKADNSAEQPEAKPVEQAEPKAEPSAGQPVPGHADAKAQGVEEEKALYGDLS
jgi:hypothetical protein